MVSIKARDTAHFWIWARALEERAHGIQNLSICTVEMRWLKNHAHTGGWWETGVSSKWWPYHECMYSCLMVESEDYITTKSDCNSFMPQCGLANPHAHIDACMSLSIVNWQDSWYRFPIISNLLFMHTLSWTTCMHAHIIICTYSISNSMHALCIDNCIFHAVLVLILKILVSMYLSPTPVTALRLVFPAACQITRQFVMRDSSNQLLL